VRAIKQRNNACNRNQTKDIEKNFILVLLSI